MMKTKTTFIKRSIFLGGCAWVCISLFTQYFTTPPAGVTGAPGETTCYTSGCHEHGAVNGPNGEGHIIFPGTQSYIPGNTYRLQVLLKESNLKAFGFELTAIDSSGNQAGDFVIVDSSNTAYQTLGQRIYISHADVPSNQNPDSMIWEFDWVAPATNIGDVRFYMAGLAAIGILSQPLGNVYTDSLMITPDMASISSYLNSMQNSIRTFPQPATDMVNITIDSKEHPQKIAVYSLSGERMKINDILSTKGIRFSCEHFAEGVYIVNIVSDRGKQYSAKCVVRR
ncbi:MAG: T9SS type A sorting domain-containing protein [Flavobacteriales bacterium]|nr:T9SS type A sorting domain-containing protein [Flavobacteriales bacterium]